MNEKLPIMSKFGVIFLTWRRYLQRDLNPYKITLKQSYVLNQLSKEEYLYPSQIADMLFCDRPTATVIINNMAREKWVRKEKDFENGKQTRIYITEEGRDKLQSINTVEADFNPLSCFTDEEKKQLELLLKKLRNHLRQIE